jgi:hypothetical protein
MKTRTSLTIALGLSLALPAFGQQPAAGEFDRTVLPLAELFVKVIFIQAGNDRDDA